MLYFHSFDIRMDKYFASLHEQMETSADSIIHMLPFCVCVWMWIRERDREWETKAVIVYLAVFLVHFSISLASVAFSVSQLE